MLYTLRAWPIITPVTAHAVIPILTVFLLCLSTIAATAAPKADAWDFWAMSAQASRSNSYPDMTTWENFLSSYLESAPNKVTRVQYAAVSPRDHQSLKDFIKALEQTDVFALTRDEQLAFWVNTYNALTVRVILNHYPVESIKDISFGLFSFGPWKEKLLSINGQDVSLDDIEHRILRPLWRDPRIHYVLNCASIGCPDLMAQPLSPQLWSQQMTQAARRFVAHPRAIRIESGQIIASSIYDWFSSDFGETDSDILNHIRTYAPKKKADALKGGEKIQDHAYDWSLNDAPQTQVP